MTLPPTVTGGTTTSAATGSATDRPFAGVTIGDTNAGATETLSITLSDPAATLAEGASFTGTKTLTGSNGSYTLTGTATSVTAELDALTLTAPATLQPAQNGFEALSLGLSDQSSTGHTASTTLTTDIVTPTFSHSFAETGAIQTFTVQTSGYYDITADGAEGGSANGITGGLGAFAGGDIFLQAGAILEIVVGSQGGSGQSFGSGGGGGGGGGGSFVIETNTGSAPADIDEVIAGGGGGLGIGEVQGSSGDAGRTSVTGGVGGGAAGGAGGASGQPGIGAGFGGGGGGFTGGNAPGGNGRVTGSNFAGGIGGGSFGSGGSGGFGGGGGGGSGNRGGGGGGGGGYGGGGGGGPAAGGGGDGGGGGSYINPAAIHVTLTGGVNLGNGVVSITALALPTITGTLAGQTTDSESPIRPFAGVTIGDANSGATDTLTITYTGPGTLAGSPLLTGSAGNYTLAGTAAAITTALDALAFTPTAGAPGSSTTTGFTLSDVSSALSVPVVNTTTTVIDADPRGAPTITGTVASQTTNNEAPKAVFNGVTVGDTNSGATDTLTITYTGPGTLSGSNALTGSAGNYSLTGSASAITTALDALSFTPVDGVPNTSVTTHFTLTDTSNAFATPTVNTTVSITDTDPAVAPTITGTVASQTTSNEAPKTVFSGVTVGDTNSGATDTLAITYTGLGTLSGSNALTGSAGNYSLTGTASAITTALDALSFTPADGVPNTSVTTSFTLTDTSSAFATPTINTTASITDTDPIVAPTITGAVASQTTSNEAPKKVFSGVTVSDANSGATDTLTITYTGPGTLSGSSALTGYSGNYTLTGTASVITTALDALSFAPADGVPNTNVITHFTLTDTSSLFATPAVNTTASITDTDPAVAPTITGGTTPTVATGSATGTPFAGVTIGDTNAGATETLSITLSDPAAALAEGASFTGTKTLTGSNGSYTLTGTATSVTTELDALTLTAPATLQPAQNGFEALSLGLSDQSSTGHTASTTLTTDIVAPAFSHSFAETGAIQFFTVQTSGYYEITADGAQGGTGNAAGFTGGLGAFAGGDIFLQAGAIVEIVVGGQGGRGHPFEEGSGSGGAGGGGGSFVIETNTGSAPVDINEVIAGGGSGADFESGDPGRTSGTGGGGGVSGGAGGAPGQPGTGARFGGGGGGFTGGNGGDLNGFGQMGKVTGSTFAGGNGGIAGFGGFGGFGGGGGGGFAGGGGGGGYGGGGGGGYGGGGGGSYVNPAATHVTLTGGVNGGNGVVSITTVAAITGTLAGQTTGSEAPIKPFAGVTIDDANSGATDTLTITYTGPGTLSGFLLLTGSAGDYTLVGTAAAITTALDALVFTPTAGAPGSSTTTGFTLSDVSSALPTPVVDTTTTVTDTDLGGAPTITGTVASQTTTSEAPKAVFSGVTVGDTNSGATDTLIITYTGPGTLSGSSALTGSTGNYTLSGTAPAITTALDALSFTPADGVPNTSVTTHFTLTDTSNAFATPAVNSTASITDTDPAPGPTITGGRTTSAETGSATGTPFAGVTIGDAHPGAIETLSISLSDPAAALAEGASFTGTKTLTGSNGSYTLTGTAASVTTELDALTLNAPATLQPAQNGFEALSLGLSDQSSDGLTASTTRTTDIVAPAFSQSFIETGAIQTFTVQTSGYYDITADGAQGGDASGSPGGSGAFAGGDIFLQAGAILEIVVGSQGGSGRSFGSSGGGGGGGGSFVIETNTGSAPADINEVIAGGGGGLGSREFQGEFANAGRASGTGGNGGNRGTSSGGSGGAPGQPGTGARFGGGGGGFTGGNGGGGNGRVGESGSITGSSFAGGNSGGGSAGLGGFGGGGGGGGGLGAGGGGGGYGGGGGGGSVNNNGGGGGGSYVNPAATNVILTGGVNLGNGVVTITALAPPTIIGTLAGQTTDSESPIRPFAGVTIGDTSSGATDTLTITYTGPGTLSGSLLLTGSAGDYTLAGTAAAITTALDALAFTPAAGAPGSSTTTGFTLSDVSSALPTPVVDTTTTVTVTQDSAPGGNVTLCFCPGTMIRTPNGEVAVENLKIGDTVITLGNNGTRPIVWIGKGKVLATRGRRGPATPVIVRRYALGQNIPDADLHVTKAHGLYLDGVLIPAEFLVNHKTILWDDRAQEVELYHIELDAHDIVLANNAPAESFRDDGNRWLFQNANEAADLEPKTLCAEVLTGGPIVDAIWRRLLDHAGPRDLPPMTDDPDLHLVIDGVRVDAWEHQGSVYRFRLPSSPGSVVIASRSATPSELGIARDPRSLGVALRQMVVRQGAKFMLLDADDERLTAGFHAYEADCNLRWTDGRAELPIEAFARFDKGAEVVLHLGGTTRYPDEPQSRPVSAGSNHRWYSDGFHAAG